jgi:5-methylcytosine-specific restriction endonuclease McrA
MDAPEIKPRKNKNWRKKTRQRLAARDGWKCHWCPKELNGSTATIDHLKNRSEGGSDKLKNLVLACYGCNTERNNRLK